MLRRPPRPTLSLHDALPIYHRDAVGEQQRLGDVMGDHHRRQPELGMQGAVVAAERVAGQRSEEHTSELQSHLNLVCRLLLEKKKKKTRKRQIDHTCATRVAP